MTFLDRWSAFYYGPIMLILCMGIYDLITRQRLQPAYMIAAPFLLIIQVVSVIAYLDPRLTPLVLALLGHGS